MTDQLLDGVLYSWANLRTNSIETELLQVNNGIVGELGIDGDLSITGDLIAQNGTFTGDVTVQQNLTATKTVSGDDGQFTNFVQSNNLIAVNSVIGNSGNFDSINVDRQIQNTQANSNPGGKFLLNGSISTYGFTASPGFAASNQLEVRVRELGSMVIMMFTYPFQVTAANAPFQWTAPVGFPTRFLPVAEMEAIVAVSESGKTWTGRLQMSSVGSVRIDIMDQAQPTGERSFANGVQAGIVGTCSLSYINN